MDKVSRLFKADKIRFIKNGILLALKEKTTDDLKNEFKEKAASLEIGDLEDSYVQIELKHAENIQQKLLNSPDIADVFKKYASVREKIYLTKSTPVQFIRSIQAGLLEQKIEDYFLKNDLV